MTPSTLLPASVRAILYVITVGLAAAYAVVEANVDLHFDTANAPIIAFHDA